MPPAPPASPVTARAVCIGLGVSVLINLVMGYNDWYLHNTLLIGNHFPYISIALLLVLSLGVNGALRKWTGINPMTPGEMMLIWGMVGIAGGIGSAGLMRYFPSYVTAPAFYASSGNEYSTYLLANLKDWMVVNRDPDHPAVRTFMEGLSREQSIPWRLWLVPMLGWFGFMGLLYATNLALVSVFFSQWSTRERLIFPAVQVPAMITEAAPPGRFLNDFFANRLTWIGIAIPLVIWGWNGAQSYLPELPLIPMSRYVWSIFPDRPWSEFHPQDVNIYFTAIGLTFLLTTEIAFSLWFIYLLYRASFVYLAWLGSGATGFWGNWGDRITVFETAGAMVVIAGFLCWTARAGLRQWGHRVLAGRRDPVQDPLSPRLAAGVLIAGTLGMIGWFLLAGAQWWAAAIGVLLFLVTVLVLTRVVAESGLIFVQSNVIPFDFLKGLFPPAWLSGFTLAAFVLHKGIHMFDLREIFMPYAMNGLKGTTTTRMPMGKVLAVFGLTAAVAVGAAAFGKITTSYKYGGVNLDAGANIGFPTAFLGSAVTFQKNAPAFDWVKAGDTNLLPVNAAHVLVGGALTAAMLFLRTQFLWWPLHPFGIIMCGTWAMSCFWFSIFLGWVAKVCVMGFLGATIYRKALPLVLGLVVGECIAATIWGLVGLLTGTPGISILPY